MLEPIETARFAVDVIASKMGADILLLDISDLTIIADYFVIATGESERQIKAITEELVHQLKEKHALLPLSVEGTPMSGWVLLDYGSVVIHIFSERQRNRYQLEELWQKARTVVRMA
ncbi:MAG: ribosome silencing factor [Anaerolineae bacterium]|nr:ribosome silencing factor [Anaerolineae bacterium]